MRTALTEEFQCTLWKIVAGFMARQYTTSMKNLVDGYLTGKIPPPTVCTSLGMTMARGADGEAEFEYTADGRHANPMGSLHGGILCDLADGAMGLALATTLDEGEVFTTLELKINFLRPVWKGKLVAKARTVSRGKTIAVMGCEVVDEKGRQVAVVSATQMILAKEGVQPRS
jgi:uncharacterized protein (TIGR00369 family)